MHQINEAKAAGYDLDEIVNGIIRTMVPSLTLRNVLETTTDLNLDGLLSLLEAHFEKKKQNWPLEQAHFYGPVTGEALFICTKMY